MKKKTNKTVKVPVKRKPVAKRKNNSTTKASDISKDIHAQVKFALKAEKAKLALVEKNLKVIQHEEGKMQKKLDAANVKLEKAEVKMSQNQTTSNKKILANAKASFKKLATHFKKIEKQAAKYLEDVVNLAVKDGAKVLLGGKRTGAQIEATVLSNVSRDSKIVAEESFGPLAPIIAIKDLDDAIEYYNGGNFGLSSGIVTNNMAHALKAAKHLRTGTTNINEVPGYRIESSPFGGIKDSGLGIKEGVIEAMKFMQNTKTFSFPWE